MRALVVGWSSVLHGEATAGDVLSMQAVAGALAAHRIEHELAWSAVMCPPGRLRLDDADPSRYTHLLWVCGPLTGAAPAALHARFAHCRPVRRGRQPCRCERCDGDRFSPRYCPRRAGHDAAARPRGARAAARRAG